MSNCQFFIIFKIYVCYKNRTIFIYSVNHRHYSRGLPEELVQSVIDCVPDFIEAYQDLEAYNDKIYQGIKPYFKKAEEMAIKVEANLTEEEKFLGIGRDKRYLIKDENELKGLQLKIVPPFYEIIDGIPYVCRYEAS